LKTRMFSASRLYFKMFWASTSVFFNLGSAEPRGSASSLRSSLRILILVLFWVSRFRQIFNIVSKVPWLEKGWKTLFYIIYRVWERFTLTKQDNNFRVTFWTLLEQLVFSEVAGAVAKIVTSLKPNHNTVRNQGWPNKVYHNIWHTL